MNFVDKTLTCIECRAEFVFNAGEQEYYADKGFDNPKRCRSCREARNGSLGHRSSVSSGQNTKTVCAECGKEAIVPFRPRPGSAVFCSECFQEQRAKGTGRSSR